MTALKHRRFYKHTEEGSYEPMLSPLYRLRSVSSEEIDEDDEPLKYMSSILGKDENRAEMVWKMWSNYSDSDSDISFEVLKGLFECIHK